MTNQVGTETHDEVKSYDTEKKTNKYIHFTDGMIKVIRETNKKMKKSTLTTQILSSSESRKHRISNT